MRGFFRHIYRIVAAALSLCVAAACINDKYNCPDEWPEPETGSDFLLVLHIRPVDTRAVTSAGDVTERISTLRIIVVNETAIEYNKLISVDDLGTMTASQFNYGITLPTTAGLKDIYLIANEASVKKIEYMPESGTTLPENLPDEFGKLLARYEVGGTGFEPNTDPTPDPEEFRKVIGSVYFAPDYDGMTDKGNIFLPYTSCYTGIEAVRNSEKEMQLFLVPVATKIVFNFVNNRTNPVEINNITVASTNHQNFLLARVGDKNKTFGSPGEEDYGSYYWVDWLAKVSEASHKTGSYGENFEFNEKYGWISDYDIPDGDEPKPIRFVGAVEGDDQTALPRVPAVTVNEETEVPGRLTLGPYYIPESRNDVKSNDGQGNEVIEQIYYLTLGLHDVAGLPENDPIFENNVLSNLRAMFRNTYLIVTINMSEGDGIDVYAEIAPWNKKYAYGWVTEGTEPNPNPMQSAAKRYNNATR